MSWENIVRAICVALVAVPNTLAAVQGLQLAPAENAACLILALVAASILSELRPAKRTPLTQEEIDAIAVAREKIRKAERDKVYAAGNRTAP